MVKERGGIAVVQDPEEALCSGMPRSALESVAVDYVARSSEMGALLARLAIQRIEENAIPAEAPETPDPAEGLEKGLEQHDMPGALSGLTCAECGGAVWETNRHGMIRYRCHVGHTYTAESMLSQQAESLEGALWTALRALEESAELARRMARHAHGRGHALSAARFDEHGRDMERRADVARRVLMNGEHVDAEMVTAGGGASDEAVDFPRCTRARGSAIIRAKV
jgi:two-component system chemotaxis response regulator CheB